MSSEKNEDTLKEKSRAKLKNFNKPFSSKDCKIFDRYVPCDYSKVGHRLSCILHLIEETTDCFKINEHNSKEVTKGINTYNLDNNSMDFLCLSVNKMKYVNSNEFRICNCLTSSELLTSDIRTLYNSINIERFLTIKNDYINVKDIDILKVINKLNNDNVYKFVMHKDKKNKCIQIIVKNNEIRCLENLSDTLNNIKNFFEVTEVLLTLVLKEICFFEDKNKKM